MRNNIKELRHKLVQFEKTIGYSFSNVDNLTLAFTHSSYANEYRNENIQSNERLEFLGDAVLNIIISEYIYSNFPHLSEGEMTKMRANIVCEASLDKCAAKISIGQYLLLGKGEELTGGRTRASILSDAFEAVLGAVYLDGGMDNAKKFVINNMSGIINESATGLNYTDYKTQLQEIIQKNSDRKVSYEIIEERGPDHNKIFVSQVKVCDTVMGTGEGKSKKEAEQNAAKIAIETMEK